MYRRWTQVLTLRCYIEFLYVGAAKHLQHFQIPPLVKPSVFTSAGWSTQPLRGIWSLRDGALCALHFRFLFCMIRPRDTCSFSLANERSMIFGRLGNVAQRRIFIAAFWSRFTNSHPCFLVEPHHSKPLTVLKAPFFVRVATVFNISPVFQYVVYQYVIGATGGSYWNMWIAKCLIKSAKSVTRQFMQF